MSRLDLDDDQVFCVDADGQYKSICEDYRVPLQMSDQEQQVMILGPALRMGWGWEWVPFNIISLAI